VDPEPPTKVAERVIWRRVGETVVAVEMGDGEVFELEGPAARIWELICAGHTRERIASALVGEYEVDPETLDRDLARTFAELADAGLIDR
jgi:hypothetical protein